MDTPITNRQDYIDSRNIIGRIEYLEEWATDHSVNADPSLDVEDRFAEFARDYPEEFEELLNLHALEAEASGYGDWQYGATLIRDSYFEEYARDFAHDVYGIDTWNLTWPYNRIDWEAAADDLKMDYVSLDFDGVTYWMR